MIYIDLYIYNDLWSIFFYIDYYIFDELTKHVIFEAYDFVEHISLKVIAIDAKIM